jgi:putative tricarboxylic transport membrane protein
LIWGIEPGPLLFVEQKDFVWGLIASIYLANVIGLAIVLSTVPLWASIMRVPFSIIAPIIIAVCAIGSYTLSNAPADLLFMVMFGVIGYLFKKLDYPLAPMVLAIVLGGRAESSFRQALVGSRGDLSVFWSNGLVGTITALSLVMLFWPLISTVWTRLRAGNRTLGGSSHAST